MFKKKSTYLNLKVLYCLKMLITIWQRKVVMNPQFLFKKHIIWEYNKVKHNKMRYVCISYETSSSCKCINLKISVKIVHLELRMFS